MGGILRGAVVTFLLGAADAPAQSASLIGSVVADSAGHEIPGAAVLLPQINRAVTANYRGEFRIDGIAPGRYLVVIRKIGFAVLQDSVDLVAGRPLLREFMLTPQVTQLDSVRVTAPERKYVSPRLRGFEERRASGFGSFISEEQLRKGDGRPFGHLLSQLPGGMMINGKLGVGVFVSSRKKCSGRALAQCATPNCYVTVYYDGALMYSVAGLAGAMPPDLGRMNVNEFAGVEFYAGEATLPQGFNAPSHGCGTLLLWTRER